MCGKKVKVVHEHHMIPWYLSHDDSDSNIMRLCPKCHKRADVSFDNLILRGKMDVASDTTKRTTARYTKKYRRGKALYHLRLLKNTFYQDIVHYNTKTGTVCIYQRWYYKPYKYRDIRVKSRSQLNNAALAKGQVVLSI